MSQEKPEGKVMEGDITVPYKWTTGEAIGTFLTRLRDDRRIMGTRCPECGKVLVPPQEFCAACFIDTKEYVGVADEGTIETYTVVRAPLVWRPSDPPYAIAAIRLDGADTELLHLVKTEDYDTLKMGMRVRAVWSEERKGSLFDIEHFEPIV